MHSTLSCALCVLLAASFVCVAHATYCRAPPDLRYGSRSGRGQRYFHPGTIVRYWCDNGYRLQGWSYTVCYYNSWRGAYWAKPAPMCIPDRQIDEDSRDDRSDDSSDSSDDSSDSSHDSSYSSHDSSDSSHDSSDSSHDSSDSSHDSSHDSSDSSHDSSDSSDDSGGIVRVRCPSLHAPQYGNIKFVSKTPGSFAKYTCNPGYGLWGNTYRKCLSTGWWTGSRPICKPRQCAELENPENGRVKMMQGRGVGAEVWYICNPGFVLVGSESRTCQHNLMWTPAAPVCKPRTVRCDSLDDPEFGSVRLTGTTVGSKATYSCDDSYVLEGVQFRFCQRDGEWSGDEPTCRRRIFSCGKLDNPANGGVIVSGTTLGSFAKYFCNDGFVVVGFRLRKCLRDGWSGRAPICKAVDCGDLDSPANGRVNVTGTRFGSTATYTCSPGYVLTKGVKIRECGADGVWSGTAPSCIPVDCGPLEPPTDGFVSITGTALRSNATYGCDGGFTLQGQRRRRCQTNGEWSGSAPTCEPMGQDCENLPNPENGRVVLNGNNPGSTATYSCDTRYRLVGSEERTCQNDGEWSESAPTCELITCPVLEDPENGMVFVTGQVLDSRATYFCNDGFLLVGAVQRRCNNDGQWAEQEPQCVPVDCGNLANPRNGRVDLTGTTFESTATYSCSTGFQLNGQETRECQADREWSGTAPTCKRTAVDCGPLGNPENGEVNVAGTTVGSKATYSCFTGYQLKGVTIRTCTADGWSDTVPTCEPIDCGPLSAPENGEVGLTGTLFGSVATYSCFPGYILQGGSTRECGADAEWTGQAPTCEIVNCGPLEDPENGRVFVSFTTFRSRARYFCNDGFVLVGISERECQADASWSDEPPVCQPVLCPVLIAPENGQLNVPSRTIGSEATYVCDTGFTLLGTAVRECRTDATWSGDAPTCVPDPDCGPLDNPANGMVMVMGTTPGSKAMYSCNLGFMLEGNMTRRCQSDGQWSGNAPTCKSADCDRLDNPANGTVVLTGTSMGDTATYSCNNGYELEGNRQRMCQMNRQWSGSEPSCRLVDCGSLDPPSNGRIRFLLTTFQSMAFYFCDPGFNLVGESKRTCLGSGDWSFSAPVCIAIDCGRLQNPPFGRVELAGTVINQRATYTCIPGYVLIGNRVRICLINGRWSGETPACRLVIRECPQLQDPANGQVSITGTTVDSTATYTCNQGYVLSGGATRQCLESGQWSDQAPTCQPVDCGPLSAPDNGQIRVFNTTLGSPAVYSCIVGFNLVGTSRRVCTENGGWSDAAPVCQPVECPALQNPTNGRVNFSSTTFGSIATYECNDGYILAGDLQRTCQDNSQWSGSEPQCIVRPPGCGDPGTPGNGRRIRSNFTVGAVVFFRCFDDFDLVGSKFRVCQENATWSGTQPVCQPFNDTCDGSKINDAVDRCARRCQCVNGRLINCCRVRRDYVDLSREDRLAYINAFITIVFDPVYRNRYNDLIALYRASFSNNASQSSSPSTSQFFVFARYFMLEYEDILKDINCSLTIPYWDWTPFPTAPYTAAVWTNDDGFGDTSRVEDGCVITGPVRVGAYFVTPSAGGGCLRRDYRNQRFPSRDIVVRDLLPLTVNDFAEFHRFLQLFIGLNVQCFVGGTMCSSDAANDPVFLLHLAQLDSLLTRWQLLGAGRDRVRYATDNGPLIFSPGFTVAQFSSNINLPHGICILYDPPALLKNHAPPPLTLASLGVPAQVATMDCAPHDMMAFMNMAEADDRFMEEHCGRTRVFRSLPSARLN